MRKGGKVRAPSLVSPNAESWDPNNQLLWLLKANFNHNATKSYEIGYFILLARGDRWQRRPAVFGCGLSRLSSCYDTPKRAWILGIF